MSVSVSFNGTTYTLPTTNDVDWGAALTAFLQAVASNVATKSTAQTLTNKTISGASNTLTNIPNSATTATAAATANTIVARDASGGAAFDDVTANSVAATTVTGTVVGATELQVLEDFKLQQEDDSATPGNTTCNSVSGKVAIAAGASQVVVTCERCDPTSIVLAQIQQTNADATLTRVHTVAGSGQFTIKGNANATAAVVVSFVLINQA